MKNDTMRGIMKPKQSKRPKRGRPLDNHYRTDDEEYEFIARTAHEGELSIADYTRRKLIPPNFRARLETLRAQQRRAGHPDDWFLHPKTKRES